MSFFGFETSLPQHQDTGQNQAFAEEDVAVYTWGDASYDTLGDALQEAGDDLNDETFGSGPVGKDFDFSGTFDNTRQPKPEPAPSQNIPSGLSNGNNAWTSNAATSVLPKHVHPSGSAAAPSVFSRLDPLLAGRTEPKQVAAAVHPPVDAPFMIAGDYASQPRTMAEIEADMKAAAMQQQQLAQQRERARILEQQQMLAQQQQQQQRLQEEERMRQEQQEKLASIERERLLQLERQARSDPLWAIRQAMMEQKIGNQGHVHERNQSIPSEASPMSRNRQPMIPVLPSQMPHAAPAQQQMMLQELLYHQQQQQQFLEQQLHAQQHSEKSAEVMADAQRRIQEAEILEAKHRRRVSKIQSMARYNDLMTQSDKDFITRVQVAQLVTSDPYADDFYAQVYASIKQQRNASEINLLKLGSAGASAQGNPNQRGPHRRENAIQRMQAQVERLVNNMKSRELSKEAGAPHGPLANVLGKTSGRSYKAAPRQLLQIAIASPESAKAHPVKEHEAEKAPEHIPSHGNQAPPPFSRAEALLIIERLFTNILDMEQLRRNKPLAEEQVAIAAWNEKQQALLDQIWQGLRVAGNLHETNPHPFIALIAPLKGKRFIGRLGRDLTDNQKVMALSVIVTLIDQVDVIRNAAILDSVEDSQDRRFVERQAYAFQEHVINQGLQLSPASRTLRVYNSLIEFMLENGPVFSRVMRTRPGLTLLEHFFAEAALLKHGLQGPDGEVISAPPEDIAKWDKLYDRLFDVLLPLWTIMFPSSRILPAFPPDSMEIIQVSLVTDGFDQPVWRFLAGFALEGTVEQHSRLVTQLRAKVMGTLKMAQRLEEGKAKARKIRNVDLFLNALGLSSSQIPLQ